MAEWEKKEGLIPEWELFKGFRGFILWLILLVGSFILIWNPIFGGLASNILHKYGSTYAIPDPDSFFYFIIYPVLKYVCALVFAFVGKGIANKVVKNHNITVARKNGDIAAQNGSVESEEIDYATDSYAVLVSRLKKGKAEIEKYQDFFKKKDWAHCFYYWKTWYAIPVALVASIITTAAAYFVVLIIAIIIDIVYAFMGSVAPQTLVEGARHLVTILGYGAAIVVGFGSIPFSKSMQKKADRLEAEDEEKGYTAAVNRVIGDVPDRYRTPKVMGKLIRTVEKKKFTTVEEAIAIYERDLKIKKGIALLIAVIAIFGIAKGINAACADMESMGNKITGDIGRSIDKSRAESEMIRQTDRRNRDLRNTAAAKQQYADSLRTNAESLRGTSSYAEANQHANAAQRDANASWRDLNNN